MFGKSKTHRVPPTALDAEVAVLGGVLSDPEALHDIVDMIGAADFYKTEHRLLFETVLEMYHTSQVIDLLTVSQRIRDKALSDKIGGAAFLSRLVDSMPSAVNIGAYAKLVREKAIIRAVMSACSEFHEKGYEPGVDVAAYLDQVQAALFLIAERKQSSGLEPISKDVIAVATRIEEACTGARPLTGVPSGFFDLDAKTAGFQRGDFIVIAGRPSMGKTSLGLSIGLNVVADNGLPVAMFSLEMSREALISRLLCMEAQLEFSKARAGKLTDDEQVLIYQAAARINSLPFFIDDAPVMTVLDVRARCRRLKHEHGLGLVIIDYLTLLHPPDGVEGREQQVAEISRGLKTLAKELDVPVLCIAQLNRKVEGREDKRPLMADLRESGAIEQDADVIVFVYLDEKYNRNTTKRGVAELLIRKQRNGATGDVDLAFNGPTMTFKNFVKSGVPGE
jgi:replicative DNA helicase